MNQSFDLTGRTAVVTGGNRGLGLGMADMLVRTGHVDGLFANAGIGGAFGRPVVISSVGSIFGAAFNEHYGVSKGAVNSLICALAIELARHGIIANAILPGLSESEMTADMFANEKFRKNVRRRIPVHRFGAPADFGGITAYLMSDLPAYHAGQSIVIGGGYQVY